MPACDRTAKKNRSEEETGVVLYFEDNAGVIVNNKGEMKGKPPVQH